MVRKIKSKLIFGLRSQGQSGRVIAAAHGMSRNSIAQVFEAADREGLSYDDVAHVSEAEIYTRLFPGRGEHTSVYVQPDWTRVHRELARVGVTLKLLHSEYVDLVKDEGGLAMSYDRFCRRYQHHVQLTGVASRVGQIAGQAVEVDWAGPTMTLTNPVTGADQKVYLFVACLPFSRYAFAKPCPDMTQIASHWREPILRSGPWGMQVSTSSWRRSMRSIRLYASEPLPGGAVQDDKRRLVRNLWVDRLIQQLPAPR